MPQTPWCSSSPSNNSPFELSWAHEDQALSRQRCIPELFNWSVSNFASPIRPPGNWAQTPNSLQEVRKSAGHTPTVPNHFALKLYRKSGEPTFIRDFPARDATKRPYALSEGARHKTAGPNMCRFRRSRAGACDKPSLISGRQFLAVRNVTAALGPLADRQLLA